MLTNVDNELRFCTSSRKRQQERSERQRVIQEIVEIRERHYGKQKNVDGEENAENVVDVLHFRRRNVARRRYDKQVQFLFSSLIFSKKFGI